MRNTTIKLGRQSISYGIRKGILRINQISNKGEIYVDIIKQKTNSYEAIVHGENVSKTTFMSASHRILLVAVSRLILPKHREEQFLMLMSNVKFFK